MQRFIVYVYFIKFIGILLLNSISFLGSITIFVLNNFFIFVYTLLSNIYINLSLDSGGTVNFNTQNVEKIVTYPLALTEEPFIIVAMSNSQYYPSWFAVEISRTIDFTLIPQGQAGWTGYFILGK